jgi:F0F1-type ATP synthase membrane subunit a
MTAGHLLICLLGSASSINALFILQTMVILTIIVLLILEISVAFIQSYVFILLASLYTVESMIQD